MAAKILLFVIAVTVVAVVANKDCDCDEKDTKELWEFLVKMSKDLDAANEEDKDMYAVLPGFLSPMLDCNCVEKSRRKRYITREEESGEESLSEEEKFYNNLRERLYGFRTIKFGSRLCPAGFAKIGYLCVPEELLVDS